MYNDLYRYKRQVINKCILHRKLASAEVVEVAPLEVNSYPKTKGSSLIEIIRICNLILYTIKFRVSNVFRK